MPPEEVHLHEVGAVDAILDVVGVIWGLDLLGVERVYCGADRARRRNRARRRTACSPFRRRRRSSCSKGIRFDPEPEGSGELVTPTGAALVRVLSSGPPPAEYVPLRSGFGAGTKDFRGRANALRVILADVARVAGDGTNVDRRRSRRARVRHRRHERRVSRSGGRSGAGRGCARRDADCRVTMKRGRPGTRVEVLCRPADAARIEELLLVETTTIGVRPRSVRRRALPRETVTTVTVLGHEIAAKSSRCRTAGAARSRSSPMSSALHWRRDGLCRIFHDWPPQKRNGIRALSVGNAGPSCRRF